MPLQGPLPATTTTFEAVVAGGAKKPKVVVKNVDPEEESMIMYTSGAPSLIHTFSTAMLPIGITGRLDWLPQGRRAHPTQVWCGV